MLSVPKTINGYTSELTPKPKENNPNRHHLRLFEDDVEVAFLSFSFDDVNIWGIEIEVNEEYRRKGVATAIYDTLESSSGKPIKFQRTAMASKAMKLFYQEYSSARKILSDDGNFSIVSSCLQ